VAANYEGVSRLDTSGGNGSDSTVTIPAGATIGIILNQYWDDPAQTMASITVDGQSASFTIDVANNTSDPFDTGRTLAYVSGFSTGASKTVSWTWDNDQALTEGGQLHILWWSGVDTSDPFISSNSGFSGSVNTASAAVTSANGEAVV
jgi:hypothetical protein